MLPPELDQLSHATRFEREIRDGMAWQRRLESHRSLKQGQHLFRRWRGCGRCKVATMLMGRARNVLSLSLSCLRKSGGAEVAVKEIFACSTSTS
jgi:hypothetical protein